VVSELDEIEDEHGKSCSMIKQLETRQVGRVICHHNRPYLHG
jgi:hypothetical protein